MKISVAQTRPIKGYIQGNIERHIQLVNLAVDKGAEFIIFPELSLTGYEPAIAKELAINAGDSRFDVLQDTSNRNRIVIGVGVPTRNNPGVCISMLLLRPQRPKQLYSKMFLHPDETRFFVAGNKFEGFVRDNNGIAVAICYELSVPEHLAAAVNDGAHTYIASVAKSANGVNKATERLSGIARDCSMTVFMANSVGQADDFQCAGNSSIWNRKGELLAQLDDVNEGIIVHDTVTQETVIAKTPENSH